MCRSLPLGWLLHRQVQVLGCTQVSFLPLLLHSTEKHPDISTLAFFILSFLIVLILKTYKDFFVPVTAIGHFFQKCKSKRRFTKSRSSTVPSTRHFCTEWRLLLSAIETCLPATRGTTYLPQKPTRFRSWQRIRQSDQEQLQSYQHQTAHLVAEASPVSAVALNSQCGLKKVISYHPSSHLLFSV